MTSRHFAIFTLMGNGHMHPILPLCSELARRGHRVTCPANSHYASQIERVGGEAVRVFDTPVDESLKMQNQERAQLGDKDPYRLHVSELEWAHVVRSTKELVLQAMEFYESDPPDIVLYNRYSLAGRLVAHRLRVPAVLWSPHFAYPGRSRYWENGISTNPEGMKAFARRLDAFLTCEGLPEEGNLWRLEGFNIHLLPKEFQYQGESFGESFWFAGSLINWPSELRVRGRKRDKPPQVLISGYSGLPETRSSNVDYFKRIVDALANTECRCVLSVGDLVSAELEELPDNFEINRHTPNLELLPQSDLIVCHGGMGSTLESIYNGVPVLAMPGSPYAEEVAFRVADLGLGASLGRSAGAEQLRDAVLSMLGDADLVERVWETGRRFRGSGGVGATADRIERWAECER